MTTTTLAWDDQRLEAEWDAAREAHTAALARFREASDRETTLRRTALTTDSFNRKNERRLEGHELFLAVDEVNRDKLNAAEELRETKPALDAATRALANARLEGLLPRYTAAADEMRARRKEVEITLVAFVRATWDYIAAHLDERRVARLVLKAAEPAARNDDERAVWRHRADRALPTAIGDDGAVQTVERPKQGLWDGTLDVTRRGTWKELGELAIAGRERGQRSIGRVLRDAFRS